MIIFMMINVDLISYRIFYVPANLNCALYIMIIFMMINVAQM